MRLGVYDGIASIEMFEAVGEKYWPSYFETFHDRLKPGAQATLQIITVRNDRFDVYRKSVDFIQKVYLSRWDAAITSSAGANRQKRRV